MVIWVQSGCKCGLPCDLVVDWELWFTALPSITREYLYCISLAQEKIKIQNSKCGFY